MTLEVFITSYVKELWSSCTFQKNIVILCFASYPVINAHTIVISLSRILRYIFWYVTFEKCYKMLLSKEVVPKYTLTRKYENIRPNSTIIMYA